jgi:ubiquinone/menaquinone biosynthesis C-methylase UbiE
MEPSDSERTGNGTMFDRAAPTYGQVGPDFFSELGDLLVTRVTIPAGSKLIDVGAGTGAVSLAASMRLGSSGSVLAIDLAPKMLAELRYRLDGRTPTPFMTAVMDAAFLGVRSASFDVALSGIALQSMSDPQSAVVEMCRVLRSVGTFGISISKGWWWEEDARWQWHAALLDELGVAIEHAPPTSGQHFLDQLLSDMPLSRVERAEEVLEFEFEDAETYWKWCWSHGWRGVMERLTAEQLDGYRRGVLESIGEGTMPGRLVVQLATAARR